MAEDALTIRQAAALLNVHPNTVRNRIKAGTYQAEKVVTENGETYLIPRSELSQVSTTNSLVTPSPAQLPSQPLPDVREAMRAMLEPFVKELGDVREELGRERERREQLQHERDELRRELDAL
ncbi:MAG: helix-turn-helix domain-containing protein, partial [Actinomycetota bacterium]|nr:helix-turn-helix domain-containing protein [Actinomycetota bacterium]